jgi:hypothetical protein
MRDGPFVWPLLEGTRTLLAGPGFSLNSSHMHRARFLGLPVSCKLSKGSVGSSAIVQPDLDLSQWITI